MTMLKSFRSDVNAPREEKFRRRKLFLLELYVTIIN